jgi:transposase
MIQKLRSPRGPSAVELAEKVGVHHGTLSRWLKEATTLRSVTEQDDEQKPSAPRPARRPEDWPPEEKLRIVQDARGLEGEALGALLRRLGLHEADLASWRQQADQAALAALGGRRQRNAEQKRVRQLESELRRKDKALAEAAALLVLSKKVQALVCHENVLQAQGANCIRDEGRPLGIGLQGQVPNHLELRR